MPKKRYKVKDVKRQEPNGQTVNYGHLVMGHINGIACLASREVLIRLGVNISTKKPPEYFYNHEHIQAIFGPMESYKVFAVNRSSVYVLGALLSNRAGKASLYHVTQFKVKRTWVRGFLEYTDGTEDWAPPKMQQVLYKQAPKRVGGLKKLWLLVKRLFSREEVVHE